jgi:Cof subfamily protein (haloacid dehalogenase superfamily)
MIKLICSDMDGTLLDENSQLPPETFDLIRQLKAKGIHFAVSSGRRYATLCEFFEPVADEIDYVASNGCQVYVDGEMVDREVFSHLAVLQVYEVVKMFSCLHLMVNDRTHTFLFDDLACYQRALDKDLRNNMQVKVVPGPEINIIKGSIYVDDEKYLMDMTYVLDRELGDVFRFSPSDVRWIDFVPRHVSKATGVEQVMSHYGLTTDEVMAFGDAMNDYELLRFVGHPVAMGNARYAVKQIAEQTIGTNVEHSVQREMRRMLENREG